MSVPPRHRRSTLACLAAAVLWLGGCAPGTTGAAGGTGTDGSGLTVATGHGWTASGLGGAVPAPGSCHYRTAADGQVLPDPTCTPGVVDAAVSDTNISRTVCRKGGYTSSVRPPASLTDSAKRALLAAYGVPTSRVGDYELDHLVELNAGGASDVRNLWPEPNTFKQFHATTFIHNDKDAVEDYTFQAICDRKVTVSAVQRAMAADWTTAVATLGLPPIPSSYRG